MPAMLLPDDEVREIPEDGLGAWKGKARPVAVSGHHLVFEDGLE
jgi:hypothetical protein